MNFLSFNVNGVRAATKKTLEADLSRLDADVIGLQETKATVEQTQQALAGLSDRYEIYGAEAEKKGYSGTAVLTKQSPLNVGYGTFTAMTTKGEPYLDSQSCILSPYTCRMRALNFADWPIEPNGTPHSESTCWVWMRKSP